MGPLLLQLLAAAPLGERHSYGAENPDFQGLASIGDPGMGAPNQQRWSAPVNPPQQGLEQGAGRSPGWEWPSMTTELHDNEQFAATGGSKHPAAVAEPKPEYHGWTSPSYRQQFEPRPRLGGVSAVTLQDAKTLPFGASRGLGGPSGSFAGRYAEANGINTPDIGVPS